MKTKYVIPRSSNAYHYLQDNAKSSKNPLPRCLNIVVLPSKWDSCKIVLTCILAFYLFWMAGCNGLALSSSEQIKRFEQAGQETPIVDANQPAKTLVPYTYRVVAGDVLELQMPAILQELSSDSQDWLQKVEPYLCRVSDAGTITLPIVGKVPVAGKTLAEVESSVVNAYFPKYVHDLPAVVCRVSEHRNQRVFAVLGLVKKPNAFPYPANVQYNLTDALALAGGVELVADPRYATVFRQAENGKIVSSTFSISSKSIADASKVIIKPGDTVLVEITPRTQINVWLSQMMRLSFGAYVRPEDF